MTTEEAFSVDAEQIADALRVSVAGDLDMTGEAHLVGSFTTALSSDGVARTVLELAAVSFIDSSGLRALLRCRDAATARDVPFALAVGDNRQVQRLLSIAGVEDWFSYE